MKSELLLIHGTIYGTAIDEEPRSIQPGQYGASPISFLPITVPDFKEHGNIANYIVQDYMLTSSGVTTNWPLDFFHEAVTGVMPSAMQKIRDEYTHGPLLLHRNITHS